MPTTTVTFNGLLVFHRKPNDLYEVGVLRARDFEEPHILRIEVRPEGDIDTSRIDADVLEEFIQDGFVKWSLDVENAGGFLTGIKANSKTPADRKSTCGNNQHDFGWLLNVEEEFNGKNLERNADQLKPVIDLTFGEMFSTCRTQMVNKVRGGGRPTEFGHLSGGTSLAFNSAQGAQLVLNVSNGSQKEEILRLTDTDTTSYEVTILNTPLEKAKHSHFHLFYDRLFKNIGPADRFEIPPRIPEKPPDCGPCPEAPDPDPFRCGGIRVNDSSGPLG
jgi:hypothetical protein